MYYFQKFVPGHLDAQDESCFGYNWSIQNEKWKAAVEVNLETDNWVGHSTLRKYLVAIDKVKKNAEVGCLCFNT